MNSMLATSRTEQSGTAIVHEYLGIAQRSKWLILGCVVWRTGGLTWVVAAAVAVIAFAGAAMLLPLDLHDARPYLAFLAGVVSIAVRQVLIQADIIVD